MQVLLHVQLHSHEFGCVIEQLRGALRLARNWMGNSRRCIRKFAFELSKPLADILNHSYMEGVVPPQWKRAVVVPIPKEKPARWDKLRPVSLTDHFAKVAEGFMAKWLLEDIDSKIDPNQYGNRKGVSTTHYLLKLMDTLHMNAKSQVT